jgi:WD40 repeat protein
MKRTRKTIIASLLIVALCVSFASAAKDDVLVGGDYSGGSIWIRSGVTMDYSSGVPVNAWTFGSQIQGVAYQRATGNIVIAFAENFGTVQIRDKNMSLIASRSGFQNITGLAVQSNGNVVVASDYLYTDSGTGITYNLGQAHVCDASTLGEVSGHINFGGPIVALAVRPDDSILIAADYNYGTVFVFGPTLTQDDSTEIAQASGFAIGTGGKVTAMAVQSNGNFVVGADYLWTDPGSGITYNLGWANVMQVVGTSLGLVGSSQHINYGGAITAVAVEPNDSIVIAGAENNGEIWVYGTAIDQAGATIKAQIPVGTYVRALAVQSDGSIVAATDWGTNTSRLVRYNGNNLNWLAEFDDFGGILRAIAIEPAGPKPLRCGDAGTVYNSMDFNHDCYVNFKDVAQFAKQWLACTDPANSNCTPY